MLLRSCRDPSGKSKERAGLKATREKSGGEGLGQMDKFQGEGVRRKRIVWTLFPQEKPWKLLT